MISSSAEKPRYYSEVDSLRAIAVIAVVFNHIDSRLLSGGFLGVDMFFVISGFVVSASLVRQPANEPLFTFLKFFYQRRIKRLYPALLFCVSLFTLLSLVIFADPEVYIKTAFYSVFGFSNMFLAHHASDYFAVSSAVNPFTHTWSLGVEEQFYLIFPLIFHFFRKHLAKVLTLLIVFSLVLFYFIKTKDSTWAFYLMPARLWQFALGAVVFASHQTRHFRKLPRHLAIIPLSILIGVLAGAESFRFSSTVLISLTTALALCFIKETRQRAYLSWKPVLIIGLYSYSIYLFHWPVLVFFKQTISLEGVRVVVALGLIVVFSVLTYKKVESPLRRVKWKWHQIAAIAVCLLFVTLARGQIISQAFFVGVPKVAYALPHGAQELDLLNHCFGIPASKMYPKNTLEMRSLLLETCHFVKATEPDRRSIFLFGNSHATEKLYSFVRLAKEENWNLYFFGKAGIDIGTLRTNHSSMEADVSRDLTTFFFDSVEYYLKPGDLVVLSVALYHFDYSTRFIGENGDTQSGELGFRDFVELTKAKAELIAKKGAELSVIAGYPILKKDFVPVTCYQPWSGVNPHCIYEETVDKKLSLKIRQFGDRLRESSSFKYISLFDHFETYLKKNKKWARAYHDQNHISVYANKALVYPAIRRELLGEETRYVAK